MSTVKVSANVSGSGIFTIASPNSNTDRTLTLPDATDTLVGKATSDTLTNKTLVDPSVTGALSLNGSNVSPVQSFRNKIINGNFDIWQRGTSTSTAGFSADRWRTANSGSTFTSSRQSFTLGQTDVPNEPTYFHRTVVTSVAGAGNYCIFIHPIESVRTLAGQTATLSFWAKADASKNVAVEFIQDFGTGGSPSSAVTGIVTTCALTTSWQKFTITVSIPSISGKTIGTDNNNIFGLVLWFDAGSDFNSRTNSLGQQSGTFDIAQVQLEAGSVATPFEVRPPGVELALCQRYFCKNSDPDVYPVVAGTYTTAGMYSAGTSTQFAPTAGYIQNIKFPVAMRSIPTLTIYPTSLGGATTSGQVSIYNISTSWGIGSAGTQSITKNEFCLTYTTSSVSTGAGMFYMAWTASAEL